VKPYYEHNGITIYHGDCRDILPTLPKVDLVLTDPPYGIGAAGGVGGYGSSDHKAKHYVDDWDTRPNKYTVGMILLASTTAIVFGGNYMTDLLPTNGHWIVWDKVGEMKFQNPFSDCELAWTNVDKRTVKKYVVIQQGFISKERERYHPTQKPVELFKAIIDDYSEETATILDPFMGSGTTLRAAKDLGRQAIGIEIEEKYCEIAAKRMAQEVLNFCHEVRVE